MTAKFFAPRRHKEHKGFLCELCAFVVQLGCGQSRATKFQPIFFSSLSFTLLRFTFYVLILIPCGPLQSQTRWQPDSTGYNYLSRNANLSQWLASPGTTVELDTILYLSPRRSIKWTIPPNSGVVTLELNVVDIDLSERVVYTKCRRNNYAAKIEPRLIVTTGKGFRLAEPVLFNVDGRNLPVELWHEQGQTAWLNPFGGAVRADLRHISKLLFRAENAEFEEQILWIDEIKYTRPRGPVCIIHFNHYRDSADSLLTPWLLAKNYPANIDFTYEYAKNEFAHYRANGGLWTRYIGLQRIAELVNRYGWSATHHGVFYEFLPNLLPEVRAQLYSLAPFEREGLAANWCFSIPGDVVTPDILAEIQALNRFYTVRKQFDNSPNELPIDNPLKLRFNRLTSAAAGPNLRGQPETLAEMRQNVDTFFARKGLLIFDFGTIVASPSPLFRDEEITLLSDAQAVIAYANSLGFEFLTFRNLFDPDPNYPQQLSLNHDYPQMKTGKTDTLRVLQNDLWPQQRDLRLAALTRPQRGQATIAANKKAILYKANATFVGTDRFQYIATDGILSDTAWVFVKILQTTAVADAQQIPLQTALYSNYPNPFWSAATSRFAGNPETTIEYSLQQTTPVTISVYNMLGQEVMRLVDETKPAGHYRVIWNGQDGNGQPQPNGLYVCKMTAGSFMKSFKMLMLK